MAKDQDSDVDKSSKPDKDMSNGPPPSKTQDNYSHHSSPREDVQQAVPPPPQTSTPLGQPSAQVSGSLRPGSRPVTGTISRPTVPDHVVKHSEPVGRPRSRNED